MESELIKINIDLYKIICGCPEYSKSGIFDESCGLQYIHITEYKNGKPFRIKGYEHLERGFFYFKVTDNKLFLLAKIKHGI